MKVGSLVECINDSGIDPRIAITPKKGNIYTIRAIIPNMAIGKKGLLLEEIENEKIQHPSGLGLFEPNFSIERFAELPIPEEIEQLAELELSL